MEFMIIRIVKLMRHGCCASLIALVANSAVLAQSASGGSPPATPVEAASVRTENLIVEINAIGSLIAAESVTLRPEIPGLIDTINFKEGDSVEKGVVLVTLEAAEYRARLDQSSANLKIRQLSFDRVKRLLEKNLTSQQQYDQEVALLDEARAARTVDDQRLRKTVLRAPFNGTLGLRLVSPGEFVKDGDDLVEITDISSLKLDFQVPEVHLTELRIGQTVNIETDAYPGESFVGEVYVIAPRLETASRSVLLRARVENNDRRLRPGMFGRVKLNVAEKKNALMIPEEALWPVGNQQYVYRVLDGAVHMTPITIGYRRRAVVEVTSGLTATDAVVTAGQMKIRDGAPVTIINASPENPRPASN